MVYINEVFVVLLGLCIGSFLNVCIFRLPRNESVVSQPSRCPECGRRLGIPDLLPVLSYVSLRGHCRHCGGKISIRYPLVELITALLFLAAYATWGISWHTASMWVLISVLVSVSVVDILHRIIPDEILLLGIITGMPLQYLASVSYLISGILGFIGAGLLLLVIAIMSRDGMGGGDIKLGAVMGLFLGWQGTAVALSLSFFIGGMAGLLLLFTRIKSRKDTIPFGPYLSTGGLIAAFYTERIINWYLAWGQAL